MTAYPCASCYSCRVRRILLPTLATWRFTVNWYPSEVRPRCLHGGDLLRVSSAGTGRRLRTVPEGNGARPRPTSNHTVDDCAISTRVGVGRLHCQQPTSWIWLAIVQVSQDAGIWPRMVTGQSRDIRGGDKGVAGGAEGEGAGGLRPARRGEGIASHCIRPGRSHTIDDNSGQEWGEQHRAQHPRVCDLSVTYSPRWWRARGDIHGMVGRSKSRHEGIW